MGTRVGAGRPVPDTTLGHQHDLAIQHPGHDAIVFGEIARATIPIVVEAVVDAITHKVIRPTEIDHFLLPVLAVTGIALGVIDPRGVEIIQFEESR